MKTQTEALNLIHEQLQKLWLLGDKAAELANPALDAIKKALAQPEQEPVVWMYQDKSTHEVRFQKHMRDFVDHGATYETPLYTTPPQRTWVGLTESDRRLINFQWQDGNGTATEIIDLVESKLEEKNK